MLFTEKKAGGRMRRSCKAVLVFILHGASAITLQITDGLFAYMLHASRH